MLSNASNNNPPCRRTMRIMGTFTRRSLLGAAAAAVASPLAIGQTQARAYAADTASKDLRKSQLFLDDTWIQDTYRLERSWESAEIFPEPMVRPETKIDGYQIVIAGGSVFKFGNEW